MTDPDIDNALFKITAWNQEAYADSPGGAYLAYWTLKKESGIQGAKVSVINLKTMKLAWAD